MAGPVGARENSAVTHVLAHLSANIHQNGPKFRRLEAPVHNYALKMLYGVHSTTNASPATLLALDACHARRKPFGGGMEKVAQSAETSTNGH